MPRCLQSELQLPLANTCGAFKYMRNLATLVSLLPGYFSSVSLDAVVMTMQFFGFSCGCYLLLGLDYCDLYLMNVELLATPITPCKARSTKD